MGRVCVACGSWNGPVLCPPCRQGLTPAPAAVRVGGLEVAAAFRHTATARRLVHQLKYRGMTAAAGPLATAMAERLPPGVKALVPVPRAAARRLRHGVDAAGILAEALARRTGIEVVRALRAPAWWPAHAGAGRRRRPPRFRARRSVSGAVLIDDVVTSGATLIGARRAAGPGVVAAVAATIALPQPGHPGI